MDTGNYLDLSHYFPGTFSINGEFDADLRDRFFDYLNGSVDLPHLTVFVDSAGGELKVLISMTNHLKMVNKPTTAIVTGIANSCGYHFVQGCNRRIALPGTNLLPHWGKLSFGNADIGSIITTLLPLFGSVKLEADDLAELEALPSTNIAVSSLVDDLLNLVNLTRTRSGLSLGKVISLFNQEPDISALQARALNLIDEVIQYEDLPKVIQSFPEL